jgi:hypothetical protein
MLLLDTVMVLDMQNRRGQCGNHEAYGGWERATSIESGTSTGILNLEMLLITYTLPL